jgi:hypothetical protein
MYPSGAIRTVRENGLTRVAQGGSARERPAVPTAWASNRAKLLKADPLQPHRFRVSHPASSHGGFSPPRLSSIPPLRSLSTQLTVQWSRILPLSSRPHNGASLSLLHPLAALPWTPCQQRCVWFGFLFVPLSLSSFPSGFKTLSLALEILVQSIPSFLLYPVILNCL